MRKVTFNIYEELPHGNGTKEITSTILSNVTKKLPQKGVIVYTLCDGHKIGVCKRERVKNEIYDIYWAE